MKKDLTRSKDYARNLDRLSPTWLTEESLEVGRVYRCSSRNFKIGLWTGDSFAYVRKKCGRFFVDVEFHWDQGPPFGTAKPILLLAERTINSTLPNPKDSERATNLLKHLWSHIHSDIQNPSKARAI